MMLREVREEVYIRGEWMLLLLHVITSRRGHQIKSKRGLEQRLEDNKALNTRGRDSIR